jgi:hypothetical protein
MMSHQSERRACPECGQTGDGPFCHHWDAAGERKVPTVPVSEESIIEAAAWVLRGRDILSQFGDWAHELFVDDDGSPETVWIVAEGRSALEAARIVNDSIGLDGDGFSVSIVYGVIDPVGDGEARFRKVDPGSPDVWRTVKMWEVDLA